MSAPRLIGVHGASNLVAWDGRIWVVPQALGPTEIDQPSHRARPGITAYPDEAAARQSEPAPAPARPGPPPAAPGRREYPVTWWEHTGRYTEFVDGISSPIMRNLATGEERSSRDVPYGACWAEPQPRNSDYQYPTGPDGLAISCKTPSSSGGYHVWPLEGRASNCTMKDDKTHRCWVRHGTVGEPITVDKNGHTCAAGGGSIDVPGFHGMLTAGVLREC